jgi:DNA polymerase III delta prime subunit
MAINDTTDFNSCTVSLTRAIEIVEYEILPMGDTVLFEGPPGCGKTSSAVWLIQELQKRIPDFGGCYTNLGAQVGVDVIGMPKNAPGPLTQHGVPTMLQPVLDKGLRGAYPALTPEHLVHPDAGPDLQPVASSLHYTDALQPYMLTPYKSGIWIGDEASKMADDTGFAKIAEVADDAKFGQYALPKGEGGWARVIFSNGIQHGSFDRSLPAHTRNRLARYYVKTVVDDVLLHWASIGMDSDWIAFAQSESNLVFSQNVPLEDEQFSTARSWTKAYQQVMQYMKNVVKAPSINAEGEPYNPGYIAMCPRDEQASFAREWSVAIKQAIASRCGEAVALKFERYSIELTHRPKFETISFTPDTAEIPEHMGVMFSTINMMANSMKIGDMDACVRYLMRDEVPPPMAALWCSLVRKRFAHTAARSPHFNKLVQSLGTAAQIAIHSGS